MHTTWYMKALLTSCVLSLAFNVGCVASGELHGGESGTNTSDPATNDPGSDSNDSNDPAPNDPSQNPAPSDPTPTDPNPVDPMPLPDPDPVDAPEAEGHVTACPTGSAEFVCEVLRITNEERAQQGLPPFAFDARLALAAQRHAIDMKQQDYFDHRSLDGRSFSDRANEASYTAFPSGENIAWGQRSPEQVMTGWMNSPGHRANILHNRHNEIGIGWYQNYWVQVMGQRR